MDKNLTVCQIFNIQQQAGVFLDTIFISIFMQFVLQSYTFTVAYKEKWLHVYI
jgi:hypothetical protein